MSENLIFLFFLFQSSRPTSLKKENIQTRNRKLNKSKLVTSLSGYLSDNNDAPVTSPSQQITSSWPENFANHQQQHPFYNQQYSQSSYLNTMMPMTTTATATATASTASNVFRQLFKEEIAN